MSPAERKALRAIARGRTKAQLAALFALIRGESDASLFDALGAAEKPAPSQDALIAEITALLAPILAPAAEKGDLLAAQLEQSDAPSFEAKGLADAVRRLRRRFSDAEIAAGAQALMEKLAREHDPRERVN